MKKSAKQILIEAWKAWLEHTGYSKEQWPLDYFLDVWKDNKWENPGSWIEAWIKATEAATLETIDLSNIKKKLCNDCGQAAGEHLPSCWTQKL